MNAKQIEKEKRDKEVVKQIVEIKNTLTHIASFQESISESQKMLADLALFREVAHVRKSIKIMESLENRSAEQNAALSALKEELAVITEHYGDRL